MVAISRRGLALLAIAACATTALAAEGPAEPSPDVATDVVEMPQPVEPVLGKKGPSPAILGGAAAGAALLLALALFGVKALGSKIIQAESATAHTKLAEEIMKFTEKITISTEAYSVFVEANYDGKAMEVMKALSEEEKKSTAEKVATALRGAMSGFSGTAYDAKAMEVMKALSDEEKKSTAEKVATALRGAMSGFSESGKSSMDLAFGDGKVSVTFDVKVTSADGDKSKSEKPEKPAGGEAQ
ncbi:hypothetical protein, conserved [Eimeria praecox]|uniref:Uncharacterized protein n=1 Tax=Eimeria praecox TaxID=51316 RepID=U6GRA1_9EIME|nr:hypothetical protein, conserved [Eimeria praecox]